MQCKSGVMPISHRTRKQSRSGAYAEREQRAPMLSHWQRFCAFTPQAARASKWPEVIHFQCEPAARAARRVLDGEGVEES